MVSGLAHVLTGDVSVPYKQSLPGVDWTMDMTLLHIMVVWLNKLVYTLELLIQF